MAQLTFGNVSADMRYPAIWYGIVPLQNVDAFLNSFSPVDVQTPIANETTVQVVEKDAANNTVVVTVTGYMPTLSVTGISVVANGIKFDYQGNFVIDPYSNNISGNATSVSATYAGTGTLVASIGGTNLSLSLANACFPWQYDEMLLSGSDVIRGGSGNDYLLGYAGADSLYGGDGNDTLNGGSDGTADTLFGGLGSDTYIVDEAADVAIENAEPGTDTVQASVSFRLGANIENLVLTGSLDLSGSGNALGNVITGNSGNNTLDGGAGDDTMYGGAGNDTYTIDSANDRMVEQLGAGTDTVRTSISYALGANVENLVLTGTGAINGTGNALDNNLTGNGVANTLTGGLGNDTLNGRGGADTLAGGSGNDTYVIGNNGVTIIENTGEGTDTVVSSISYQLGSKLENLVLTGTASIGRGNELNNRIEGNSSDNTLDGGLGSDTLAGGTGNDTYTIDNPGDVVQENIGEGMDLVRSSVSYALGANVENLLLLGTANLTGNGNALANVLTGNAGNNYLTGQDGNDSLDGGGGNDTLDGGTGLDTLRGGAGNDTYVIGNGYTPGGYQVINAYLDLSYMGSPPTRVASSDMGSWSIHPGDLTADGSIDYLDVYYHDATWQHFFYLDLATNHLGSNLADGTYQDAQRAAFADPGHPGLDFGIDGAGYNTLSGSFTIRDVHFDYSNGTPVLLNLDASFAISGGQEGTIHYNLSAAPDVVLEAPGEGSDTVRSSITYTLGANVENLVLLGNAYIDGTGNDLDNLLTGNSGNNVLTGGSGNDTLDGGAGNDTMLGGSDDDTYVVNALGDTVIENPGEGTDLVRSYLSYTLGADVENLTLLGTGNLNASGNTLDNLLNGNVGNNTLNGMGGNDTMAGGLGDDTYVVNAPGDTVIENPGEGTDLVRSYIGYTLGANVENVALLGTASLSGTGNALDNVLIGNTGNNILGGGDGNDTITGGAGADRLTGGAGADIFKFAAITDSAPGTSRDVITDFGSGDRIDLSAIDANTLVDGDQSFALTTGGAFSGSFATAGTLYFDSTNDILYGNNDGDSQADFSIKVNLLGIASLTSSDLLM